MPAAVGSFGILAYACRKSNPDILVVQSTQDRTAKNVSGALNSARCRRIHVQRWMRTYFIAVVHVRQRDVAEVSPPAQQRGRAISSNGRLT